VNPDKSILADIPWRWMACWLLLPNIAVVLLWPLVGVPMQAAILVSGGLALIFSQLPWQPLRRICAVFLFIFVTTIYVCKLFAIPPLRFSMVAQFLSDVRPFRSPEYMAAIAVGLVVIGAIAWIVPKAPRLKGHMQVVLAAAAVLMFINLDAALATPKRTTAQKLPPAGTPIDSAVIQTGLQPVKGSGRHVLVILVEALGVPAPAEERSLFSADWDRPEWRSRNEVTTGTSRYFGSTTNGEMRELCGKWADYSTYDFDNADCLPQHFRNAGYETTAIHAFSSKFFDRETWYPKIGFENMVFSSDLKSNGARACPGVFPGACDVDVVPVIADRLKQAKSPQFVYWLTLNTHVPVGADTALGTQKCTLGSANWRYDYPPLCRLYQLHHNLAEGISGMIMAEDFPETDILIVGDHRPPIFDRYELARFKDGLVPWVYLKARGRSEASDAALDRVAFVSPVGKP